MMPLNQFAELAQHLDTSCAHLHESTSPQAIADAQRADVYRYRLFNPTATTAEIGADLVLDEWTVLRRVAELDGTPMPEFKAHKMAKDGKSAVVKVRKEKRVSGRLLFS